MKREINMDKKEPPFTKEDVIAKCRRSILEADFPVLGFDSHYLKQVSAWRSYSYSPKEEGSEDLIKDKIMSWNFDIECTLCPFSMTTSYRENNLLVPGYVGVIIPDLTSGYMRIHDYESDHYFMQCLFKTCAEVKLLKPVMNENSIISDEDCKDNDRKSELK